MTRNVSALVVGVLMLIAAGAVGITGTFAVDQEDSIRLSPHPENGEYVTTTGDGEIAISMTAVNNSELASNVRGINENSTYRIDAVFNITYVGDTSAQVYLNDSASDVTFYRNQTPGNSLEGKQNNVTLQEDETIIVGMQIDTRGSSDVEELSTMTVVAKLAEPTEDVGGGTRRDRPEPEPRLPGAGVGGLISERGQATVEFTGDSAVRRATIQMSVEGTNLITVRQAQTLPEQVPEPDGKVIGVVGITVPETIEEQRAQLQLTVRRDQLGDVEPSRIVVAHLTDDGTWKQLDTQVVEAGPNRVVVRAETPGFSLFAVTVAPGATPTPTTTTPAPTTTTPTPTTATPEPETTAPPETTTVVPEEPSGFRIPGFGPVVAIVALLVAALAAVRRANR